MFLTRLAGGVENEAIAQRYIDASTTRQRFSERLVDFLDRVGFDFARFKLDAKVASAEIEGRLRKDDSFREAVQASLAGSLLQLSTEVTDYLTTIISEMKDRSGTSNVVVIVDSVEKLRDTEQTDGAVMRSVRTVFARDCDLLRCFGRRRQLRCPPAPGGAAPPRAAPPPRVLPSSAGQRGRRGRWSGSSAATNRSSGWLACRVATYVSSCWRCARRSFARPRCPHHPKRSKRPSVSSAGPSACWPTTRSSGFAMCGTTDDRRSPPTPTANGSPTRSTH